MKPNFAQIGYLKNMICGDINQNLESIPTSKNRSKIQIILNILKGYIKTNGLVISLENGDIDHAKSRPLVLIMAG